MKFSQNWKKRKKGIAEADDLDTEPKVVIAGGTNDSGRLNSVEMFDLSTGTWTQLQPMTECRSQASSVVYNNQVIVTGGMNTNGYVMKSMERLSTDTVHARQSMYWEKLTVELPGQLYGHCIVVYNGRLIVIGGSDRGKGKCSDSIYEVFLVPPNITKTLAVIQPRCNHGVTIVGDRFVIVGGETSGISPVASVVMYDITENKFEELAPLPYPRPVSSMAIVNWGDDNIVIIGGVDSKGNSLNKVLIYNIKTQKCHMLPDMKYKRSGCVAAVVKDTVIVMGGRSEKRNYLKSVECFRFDRYTWEELPEMHEARYWATAVVC